MAKRALLVGCLYQGTKHPLKGCVNDCLSIKEVLENYYGFAPGDIVTMLESDPSNGMPTGGNIKRKLRELAQASSPGDVLVFHYSGHGVQVPSDRPEEEDRKDEALCPLDMNVITDDDLRHILKDMADGVNFIMIADCCHSGTLLDHSEVVITGPKGGDPEMPPSLGDVMLALMGRGEEEREASVRAIPSGDYLEMLAEKLGVPIQPGQIRASMKEVFGEDATIKVQNIIAKVGACVEDVVGQVKTAAAQPEGVNEKGMGSLLGALAAQVAATAIESYVEASSAQPAQAQGYIAPPAGGKPPADQQLPEGKGILITGCQSHETSADAHPPGQPDKAYGALTNALVTTIKQLKAANPDANISYRTLVATVRDNLTRARFPQNPCLEGSSDNADRPLFG